MIELISVSDLKNFNLDWDKIYTKGGNDNPFLTWEWINCWSNVFQKDSEIIVSQYINGANISALACFQKTNQGLRFFADPEYADYAGAICYPGYESDLLDLIHEITDAYPELNFKFGPVRAIDKVNEIFEILAKDTHQWRKSQYALNPVVKIEGSFDQYFLTRSRKLRQEIRTTENRLKEMGGWNFVIGQSPEEIEAIYLQLVEFHLGRQSKKAGNSIFNSLRAQKFFHKLLTHSNAVFAAQVTALTIGTRIVSAAYTLRSGKVLYYWIPSFDHTIPSVSLGKLHIKCLIEHCYNNGLECFDFMGGTEAYKFQWANDTYILYEYRKYKNSLQAKTFDICNSLRTKLKLISSRYRGLRSLHHYASKIFS